MSPNKNEYIYAENNIWMAGVAVAECAPYVMCDLRRLIFSYHLVSEVKYDVGGDDEVDDDDDDDHDGS